MRTLFTQWECNKILNIVGYSNPGEKTFEKYENHLSNVAITGKFSFTAHFEFTEVHLRVLILTSILKKLLHQIAYHLTYLRKHLIYSVLFYSRYGMMILLLFYNKMTNIKLQTC